MALSHADKINDQVAASEKRSTRALERVDADGVARSYPRRYRMGVLVGLSNNKPAVLEAGKDIAMQIAAMNPVAVDPIPFLRSRRREKIHRDRTIKNDPKMAGRPTK